MATKRNLKNSLSNLDEDDKTVWNAELIKKALDAIENGFDLKITPFYEKDISYRKADVLYEYNEFEISEIKKCSQDIIHFANTYAYTMTDFGLKIIELRDYQIDVLRAYQENKEVIFMASRQIGKCVDANTKIFVKKANKIEEISLLELYYVSSKFNFWEYFIFLIYCKILKLF
jgi:hypothetical protein